MVSGWVGELGVCEEGQGRAGYSRGVEAARDVGLVDHGQEFEVGSAGPVAVGFAEVDVQEGFVLDWAHGAGFTLCFLLMLRLMGGCFLASTAWLVLV